MTRKLKYIIERDTSRPKKKIIPELRVPGARFRATGNSDLIRFASVVDRAEAFAAIIGPMFRRHRV